MIKQSEQEKRFLAGLRDAVTQSLSAPFVIKTSGVARFFLALIAIVVVVLTGIGLANWKPTLGAVLIASGVPAVFLWFANLKFEDLFVIQETPIDDPKMVFPEQFEEEFRKLVVAEQSNKRKLVIAIDDIDRCDSSTIRDVLTSVKFLGTQNCYFVVPCDEKAVSVALGSSDGGSGGGYKDESLRKYFNISLRFPPIPTSDLVDFANSVVRATKLPEDIVQLAVQANCRDARKMKHFLNTFVVKYHVAKIRERSGTMPVS